MNAAVELVALCQQPLAARACCQRPDPAGVARDNGGVSDRATAVRLPLSAVRAYASIRSGRKGTTLGSTTVLAAQAGERLEDEDRIVGTTPAEGEERDGRFARASW